MLHFSQRFLQIVPVNIRNFLDLIHSIWSERKQWWSFNPFLRATSGLVDWNAKQRDDVEGDVKEVAVVWAWGYARLQEPQQASTT